MSVTLVTEEMKYRERTGFNAYTIPGCINLIETLPETLDKCIMRVFSATSLRMEEGKTGRRGGDVYARHLYRHILERLTIKGTLTNESRCAGVNNNFRYTVNEIGQICGCRYSNAVVSSRSARNLMETNKDFKTKADRIFKKIELNLIKFPEL